MPETIKGHAHPTSQLQAKICSVLGEIGFEVITGPELTTERLNFDVLRIPADHPSRDVQDTFWTKDGRVLRTHTSAMQIPAMKERKPPQRIIIPGRVYRNEATDATHEATLSQVEVFVIDKNVNMGHLIWTIQYLLKNIFGEEIETKFYPHNYPFVEPGMDVLIRWKGKWLEVLGSGMIHPDVITNMGLDSNVWGGFAFGLGADRFMMLQRVLNDIRISYSTDLRFNYQF